MATALPKLKDLLPPLDHRSQPSRQEINELRTVRLALVMMTTVLLPSNLLDRHRPIQGGYDADIDFLFLHLEPLARVSPTVRRIRSLFDRLRYSREFNNTTTVRRNLRVLARAAVRLARTMEAAAVPPSRGHGPRQ